MTQRKSEQEAGATDPEYEEFTRARALQEAGQLKEAEEILLDLVGGEYAFGAQLALGTVLLEQEKAEEAVSLMARLVETYPESESVSLLLFHSLWMAQRREEAFLEMKRFLADHESWEYRRLRSDLKREGYLVPS